jgi:hypothetical protein
MKKLKKLDVTLLELSVLVDVAAGRDPWRDCPGTGSRIVSQALARLERKGFLVWAPSGTGYMLTPAAREIVPATVRFNP